jgi:hypothetical protein
LDVWLGIVTDGYIIYWNRCIFLQEKTSIAIVWQNESGPW